MPAVRPCQIPTPTLRHRISHLRLVLLLGSDHGDNILSLLFLYSNFLSVFTFPRGPRAEALARCVEWTTIGFRQTKLCHNLVLNLGSTIHEHRAADESQYIPRIHHRDAHIQVNRDPLNYVRGRSMHVCRVLQTRYNWTRPIATFWYSVPFIPLHTFPRSSVDESRFM